MSKPSSRPAAPPSEGRRNASRFSDARLHAVSSRNMYSEHGLEARIGAGPGGITDLLPQLARLDGLGDLSRLRPPEQIPVGVGLHRLEELVGHAHRVVGVLARDREIGVRIPVGVVYPV